MISDARIVGQNDADLVRRIVDEMPNDTRFIECGPWLGYLSRILAERGPVWAIDTFKWSKDHAKRIPGLHDPGDSFQSSFDANNAQTRYPVIGLQTDFSGFVWDGPQFDLCLIDAPKSADRLAAVLKRVLPHMAPEAPVVIINGRNLKHLSMVWLVSKMVEADLMRWREGTVLGKSKAAVLECANVQDAGAILDQLVQSADEVPDQEAVASLDDPLAVVSFMASQVERGHWTEAYHLLAQVVTMPDFRTLWEEAEAGLDLSKLEPEQFGYFSHMVDACLSDLTSDRATRQLHKNTTDAVEEFWFRNADKPWRVGAFHPAIIARAQQLGYIAWPSEISVRLGGKRVIDVGCGNGLHGIGVLAAGAECYHGVDPDLRLDVDRVKDLIGKAKIEFGHTGQELMDLIQPYRLFDRAIEEMGTPDVPYDLALLHMVTPHLHNLELAMASISRLLSPGGQIVLKHRNYNAWNGHQIAPNTVDVINLGDPAQMELVDWRHLTFAPAPDHYIARKLNRVSLAELRRVIELFFEIEIWMPKQSTEKQGLGRLTDEIRARHPDLEDDDFETQTVFCVARRR